MRIFTAINFTPEVKSEFFSYAMECRLNGVRGKLTLRDNFHMTLYFLGEQDASSVKKAQSAMDKTAKQIDSFTLTFDRTGTFGGNGGYLFWAGAQPPDECKKLYRLLGEQLAEKGFEIEDRPFKPHVTVVRNVRTEPELFPKFEPIEVKADGITLFESKREAGRLIYDPIGFSKFT